MKGETRDLAMSTSLIVIGLNFLQVGLWGKVQLRPSVSELKPQPAFYPQKSCMSRDVV
jgi:hypothetical protein